MTVRESTKFTALDIKIARIRAGLKQYEVAARVGIGPTQLSEIENGRREIPPEFLEKLLQVISGDAGTKESSVR